jgi:hypothetical protein
MTTTEATERCIGCGAMVPRIDGPVHRYMTSAPGCWAKYGEVCAHHLSDPGAGHYRQWCADAYAVQHPGQPGPQAIQSVGGHLVSLLAQLELGLPLSRASALMERGIQLKGYFAWLTPPSFRSLSFSCLRIFMIRHGQHASGQRVHGWHGRRITARFARGTMTSHERSTRIWPDRRCRLQKQPVLRCLRLFVGGLRSMNG